MVLPANDSQHYYSGMRFQTSDNVSQQECFCKIVLLGTEPMVLNRYTYFILLTTELLGGIYIWISYSQILRLFAWSHINDSFYRDSIISLRVSECNIVRYVRKIVRYIRLSLLNMLFCNFIW